MGDGSRQRRDPTLHHGSSPHRPLVVLALGIPVLQTAYSDIVAFKHKLTSLSGIAWKKTWRPVLALDNKQLVELG